MAAARPSVNMGFTSETFPDGTHMCFIYSDETERRRVISKFIQSGLALGEHVSYFADSMPPQEVKKWLREMGVALPAGDSEPFALTHAHSAYCPSGAFVPDALFDGFRGLYQQCIAKGYAGVRMTGEMSWALRGMPGAERLMEYEAMATEVSTSVPVISLCQYDANRFDGATIMKALKVHPMMVVHGQIVRNPYYVKPQDFLKEHGYRS
jgi:hypothetical protein